MSREDGEPSDLAGRKERIVGCLIINEYGKDTREFAISTESVTIGRDPRGDVVLDDAAVSRSHARILRQGQRFLIQDLGSTNGTVLNDQKVPPQGIRPLQSGDRVRLGRSLLRFLLRITARISTSLRRLGKTPAATEKKEEDEERRGPLCLFRLAKIEAALLFAGGGGEPRRCPLRSDRSRIGRNPSSDVVLPDASVSKNHAEVVYNRDGFHLVDRDSTLGTLLDGVAVHVARLEHRSYVKFGKVKALFLVREEGKDPPEPSFRLRDHLIECYPDREAGIRRAFQESREQASDLAEELILAGVLDPEEWWASSRSFKEEATAAGSAWRWLSRWILPRRR